MELFPFSLLTRIEGRKQGNQICCASKEPGLQRGVREGWGSGSRSERPC